MRFILSLARALRRWPMCRRCQSSRVAPLSRLTRSLEPSSEPQIKKVSPLAPGHACFRQTVVARPPTKKHIPTSPFRNDAQAS
eukprot:5667813-Pyramimonas_sp.AAC.1